MILTEAEIVALYRFLANQYISYETPELIELVRKLGVIVDELANRPSTTT